MADIHTKKVDVDLSIVKSESNHTSCEHFFNQCDMGPMFDVFDEYPVDDKQLNVSDETKKDINLHASDTSEDFQKPKAILDMDFHASTSEHFGSNHMLEEFYDEKIMSFADETNKLVAGNLPSICLNLDLSEQFVKLECVRHNDTLDIKENLLTQNEIVSNQSKISERKEPSNRVYSDYKSSVLSDCFLDKKIIFEPFVNLKKLDCVRCYEKSLVVDGEIRHGGEFSCVSSWSNLDANLRFIKPTCQDAIKKNSLVQLSKTGRKSLLVGKQLMNCLAVVVKEDNCIPQKAVSDQLDAQRLCYHCGKRFASSGSLRNHIIRYTSDLSKITHSCLQCGQPFLRKDNMTRHMRSHLKSQVGEKPHQFVCTTCGKSYTRSDRLKLHIRDRHTGNAFMFRCTHESCGKAFNRADVLVLHMRTHSGEKPYSCDDCGFRTACQSNLRCHMRKFHVDEKPYKCKMCTFSSKEPFHRNGHMAQHGELCFVCDICKTNCGTKSGLIKHIETHEKKIRKSSV